jgi:hypothetical protein
MNLLLRNSLSEQICRSVWIHPIVCSHDHSSIQRSTSFGMTGDTDTRSNNFAASESFDSAITVDFVIRRIGEKDMAGKEQDLRRLRVGWMTAG